MGEILGIGVTHYPGLIQPDAQMAGLLNRTLDSDQVPEAVKDPKTWPAQMREEWKDPVAAATEHRRRLVNGFREARVGEHLGPVKRTLGDPDDLPTCPTWLLS